MKTPSLSTTLNTFRKSLLIASLVLPAAFMATGAEARLVDARLPIPTGSLHEAVHLPTGCISRVYLDEQKVVTADITDPDCLPKSVLSQPVPGRRIDFVLLPLPQVQ